MLRYLLIIIGLLNLASCYTGSCPVVVQTTNPVHSIIVSPVPPDQEVVMAPKGSRECFLVPPGWYDTIWVPRHKVCRYKDGYMPQGNSWIAGYWHCDAYNQYNTCNHWTWIPAHWSNSLTIY